MRLKLNVPRVVCVSPDDGRRTVGSNSMSPSRLRRGSLRRWLRICGAEMEKTVRARHHGNAMRALHISEERMGRERTQTSSLAHVCVCMYVYVCARRESSSD